MPEKRRSMYPELFEIPVLHITVKSYGLMMVIGFLAAVAVIRRLSRPFTPDPQLITNAALYALIGGVAGARIHYVVHYREQFRGNWLEAFAIWRGRLELLGGVLVAILIVVTYMCVHQFVLKRHKLAIRRYLDVLAIGLMLALVPGRIGCFLNGCCYGKPTDLPWGVRFPYNSLAYNSQINADPKRHRAKPYLPLPREEYSAFVGDDGKWYPKPFETLTVEQQYEVTKGKYRALPVHPTQIYSSLAGGLCCLVLYLFWRRAQRAAADGGGKKLFGCPGQTFALMFILYGFVRFLIEFLRDDNPFEYGPWAMRVVYIIYRGGTIAQNIDIYLIIFGVVLMVLLQLAKPAEATQTHQGRRPGA